MKGAIAARRTGWSDRQRAHSREWELEDEGDGEGEWYVGCKAATVDSESAMAVAGSFDAWFHPTEPTARRDVDGVKKSYEKRPQL